MEDNRIKILQAIRQGNIGGGETHVLDLVKNLDKSKFKPIVLSFTDGPMIDELNKNNIKNYVVNTTFPFDLSKTHEVYKIIKDEEIDIVHAHGTRAHTNVLISAKLLGLPLIYTVHGWSFHDNQKFLVKKLRQNTERLLVNSCHKTILVSKSNLNTGKNLFRKFNSTVINNGIDLSKFNNDLSSFKNIREELEIPEEATLIGCIMRLTIQKDPITMIKAFAKVLEGSNTPIYLLLVGDGDLKGESIKLIDKLNIGKYVKLTGFRTDVPDILNSIDIFCLPSLWEGLPIGLIEAMAMKKAVIASKVDGSKEIINDGENGILFEPRNTQGLTDALKLLINDSSLRITFGESAKEKVANFYDVQVMKRKVEDTYLSTIKDSDKYIPVMS